MATNQGLLIGSAIANALSNGIQGYKDESRYQDEQKMKKKLYTLGLLKEGFQENGDEGFSLTPEEQQKRARTEEDRQLDRSAKVYGALPEDYRLGSETGRDLLNSMIGKKKGLVNPSGRQVQGGGAPFQLDAGYQTKKQQGMQDAITQALAIETAKKDLEMKQAANPTVALQKLPAEGKKAVGQISEAMSSLGDYETAFNSGQRQGLITPQSSFMGIPFGKLKSSTDIDRARMAMVENLGRLQSGGAINAQENANFANMLPTKMDSDEQAIKKLEQFDRAMSEKLTAYGTNEQAAGIKGRPGLVQKNNSASAPSPHPQDSEAVSWAKQNPSDARAVQILKLNGM